MPDLTPFQTEVLCLLIGGNPLPDYVSAILLAAPRARVYLLHTSTTFEIAQRLAQALTQPRPDITYSLIEISKADPWQIENRLQGLIREWGPNAQVGLNYTGGSKPMAAQVYHSLRQAYPRGIFSYLDADTLSLVINAPGMPTQQVLVGQDVQVDFPTLFAMHDYEFGAPRREAKQPVLCRSLAQIHTTPEGTRSWYDWRRTLVSPAPLLPDLAQYPALRPVIEAFTELIQGQASPEAEVAQALGFESLRSCADFFKSKWLEEYAFEAIANQATALNLKDWAIDLNPHRPYQRPFNIDIAAIVGYQLFAISCMATEISEKAKEHLLEIFVRARQIGGDEARFAVVCYVDDYQNLQKEVEQNWGAEDKIRVFGRSHLPDLAAHLREWIIKAAHLR